MKRIFIALTIVAITALSCSPKFGKIPSKYKFSKWMVVEKYEVDTECVYYWNRGMNVFNAPCDLYNVGDTIKHQ